MLVPSIFDSFLLNEVFKIAILVFFALYIIFSLIIVRQVSLMSRTVVTPVSPVVRLVAVINAGLSIGFLVLFLGVL